MKTYEGIIPTDEEIETWIALLAEHGIYFCYDDITDKHFIEVERKRSSNDRFYIKGRIPSMLKNYIEFIFASKLKLDIRKTDVIKYLIFSGEDFAKRTNPIKEFWDSIQEEQNTAPLYAFVDSFISDDYKPAIREKIIKYLIKWFIITYKTNLAKGRNNVMLILVGPEGIGKKHFIENLFPRNIYANYRASNFLNNRNSRKINFSQVSKALIYIEGIHNIPPVKVNNYLYGYITDHDIYIPNKWKKQRACYIASTHKERFLPNKENLVFFAVKVKEYDDTKYIEPKKFWEMIKYLANNVYPDVVAWKKEEQVFLGELNKAHIKFDW